MSSSANPAPTQVKGFDKFLPGLPIGINIRDGQNFVFDEKLKPANTLEIENPSLQFATAGASTPGDYEYKKSTRYTDSTCSLFFWLQLAVLVGIGSKLVAVRAGRNAAAGALLCFAVWGAIQTSKNALSIGNSINLQSGVIYSPASSPSGSPSFSPTPSVSPSQMPTPSASPSVGADTTDNFGQTQEPEVPSMWMQPMSAPRPPTPRPQELVSLEPSAPTLGNAQGGVEDLGSSTDTTDPGPNIRPEVGIKQFVHPSVGTTMWLLACVAVSGFLLCLGWIAAVLQSGRYFVQFAVIAAFISLGCIAVFFYFVVNSVALAGICGGIACLVLLWYATVKAPQRKFVASNLEVSLGAVGKLPMFWTAVVTTLGISLVFVVVCIGAFVGVLGLSRLGHLSDSQAGGMFAGCAMLFIWSLLVFKHTLYFTIAGALVNWWKTPFVHQAVESSWLRAWTSSLGTVALGSAYLSVLQLMCDCRGMTKRGGQRGRRGACFQTVCFLCLGCWTKLGDAMEFYSPFAFVFATISGTDLHTSGLRATRLFQDKGLTSIVNSRLVDRALQLSVFSIALLNTCIALGLAYVAQETPKQVQDFNLALAGTGAAVFGLLLGTVASAAVYSAVQTVFLCWAVWPNKLQENHGMQFYELHATWMSTYPDTMAKAGYDKFGTGGPK